ncbi:MAG: FG-GAP repeat protein [Deltaproteobacteria bacterium]|nr:FG-GAP repeat protein [Deltaproteobacteria bacterium]
MIGKNHPSIITHYRGGRFLIACLAGLILLTGCKGGGKPDPEKGWVPPPAAPVLELLGSSVKALNFGWSAAEGATWYRMEEDPAQTGDFITSIERMDAPATGCTVGIATHLMPWSTAQYRLQACNGGGCTPSEAIPVADGMLGSIGYFKASNPGSSDWFGHSTALSGDGATLAVGADNEDGGSPGINGDQGDLVGDAGAVYVFTKSDGVWVQQAYVKASNPEALDLFGVSVALSHDGNTLAVGAWKEGSNSTGINGDQLNNSAYYAGAVYVYTRSGDTWSQQAYIKPSNTMGGANFGVSVALSLNGDILAVGSPNHGSPQSGAAYIFTRSGDTWSEQAFLKSFNPDGGDRFGAAVALDDDGDTLAVSATWEDSAATGIDGDHLNNSLADSGAVYVFSFSGTEWSQQAYIKASNTGSNDWFGMSLTLSGDGNTMVAGSPQEDALRGAAYVFLRQSGTWSEQAYLKTSNISNNAHFGNSVSLAGDGNLLAVGAWGEGGSDRGVGADPYLGYMLEAGAAYLLERHGGLWSHREYVKASNTDPVDRFGFSVSLSDNGDTLAVGSVFESSASTGLGGNQDDNSLSRAGAVYLY